MTANVSVIISIKKDVLRIPNAALRFKLIGEARSPLQRHQKRKGPGYGYSKTESRSGSCFLGISDGSYTEIISGDLKEGQELIVESLAKANTPETFRAEDVLSGHY